MSSRPIYNDGLLIHDTDLSLETSSRISEDNTRLIDLSSNTGVASGLGINVNGTTATLIDIQTGHGYAPNGEYIEVDAVILGIALVDYTLSTANVVTLMYTETYSAPRAHETLGTAPNTIATRSFRVRVFTVAQYNALPATNTDLTQDAKDRALVIAGVSANGAGVSLTTASLTRASDMIWHANPVDLQITTFPNTATGLELSAAVGNANSGAASGPSAQPPLGNGTLVLVSQGPGSTTSTLQWTAPGDAAGGTVTVTAPGLFTVTSGAPSFSKLFVFASPELFPAAVTTATVTVNLSQDIYFTNSGDPQMESADDKQHRAVIGSVAASTFNPHGVRGSDISAVLRIGQGMVLGAAMPDIAAHALIPRRTVPRANVGGPFTLIDQFAGGGSSVLARLYTTQSGTNATTIWTINAKWTGANWVKDLNNQPASIQEMQTSGPYVQIRFAANNAAWTTWDQTILATDPNLVGTYSDGPLNLGFGTPGTSNSTTPDPTAARIFAPMDATVTTERWLLMQHNDAHGGTFSGAARWYVKGSNSGAHLTPGMELVLGASWNGTNWVRDNTVGTATKYEFSTDPIAGHGRGIHIYTYNVATGSPFADAAWVEGWYLSADPATSGTSLHENGRLGFGPSGSNPTNSNPVATVPIANSIMAKNCCKAWGLISLTGGAPVLLEGFNVASIAVNGGTTGITVTYAQALVNPSAAVCATLESPTASFGATGFTVGVFQSTGTTFDVCVQNDTGSAVTPTLGSVNGYKIHFHVMGVQV